MKSTENQLRMDIVTELKKVTQGNSPNLWKLLQNQNGFERLEIEIIERVIRDGLTPSAIIPQMESELTFE